MTGFIIKRLTYGLLVMWGVATVVFFLFNVLPGDPARMMLDQREDVKQLENIRAKYGFDRSLSTQYFLYLNDVSPLSFHHSNLDAYTHISKYKANPLFAIGAYEIALKIPYLRTSFKKKSRILISILLQKSSPSIELTPIILKNLIYLQKKSS